MRTVKLIRESGMKAAVAVKPNTPIQKVDDLLDDVNMVLVMVSFIFPNLNWKQKIKTQCQTVEPGFGGQSFMENMMPKVQYLRNKKPLLNIQVDGGLAPDTVKVILKQNSLLNHPHILIFN